MTVAEAAVATAATHQAAQSAIAGQLVAAMPALWAAYLDVNDLEATLPTYSTAVAGTVQQYGRASAVLAARFYENRRKAAGIPGTYRVSPAAPPNAERVTAGVRWATKGLWSKTPDVEGAQKLVIGAAENYALDGGRTTIIRAVQSDRKSTGWARQVEPGACSFCLLLATRGAVYRTERTADFRAHDHCHCHVDPLFGPYEPSAEVIRAMALYRSVKGTAKGPAATRRAFRHAVESDRSKS